jgi:hypothetical protein
VCEHYNLSRVAESFSQNVNGCMGGGGSKEIISDRKQCGWKRLLSTEIDARTWHVAAALVMMSVDAISNRSRE